MFSYISIIFHGQNNNYFIWNGGSVSNNNDNNGNNNNLVRCVRQRKKTMNKNESPPIFFAYENLFNTILINHKKIEKTIRIILVEKNIIPKLERAMLIVLEISLFKNKLEENEITFNFNELEKDVYLIQSHFSFLLNNKYINDSLYKDLSKKLISCQKQAKAWKKYIIEKKRDNK